MDPKRQAVVFRAFMKRVLYQKGLRFDKETTIRGVGQELKELNDWMPDLKLTTSEFLGTYLEIMGELTAEHFAMIEKKIAEEVQSSKPQPESTGSGIPGPAFRARE